jgi:hypothetical protein
MVCEELAKDLQRGNFGIVTSFDFRVQEVGPTVLAGMVVYSIEDGPEVLTKSSR